MDVKEPDYSKYSLDELYDVSRHIDRTNFPDRARRVDEQIRKRLGAQPQQQKTQASAPWTRAVGILGLVFGSCGVLNSTSSAIEIVGQDDPALVAKQGLELIENAKEQIEQKGDKSPFQLVTKSMNWGKNVFMAHERYRVFNVITVAVGGVTYVLYFVGALLLLIRKRVGVPIFSIACVMSVVLTLGGGLIFSILFDFPLLLILLGGSISVLIDIGLLGVTLTGDRGVFKSIRSATT